MKINEVLTEAGLLKAVGKGVAQGLSDIAAPGAWDDISGALAQTKADPNKPIIPKPLNWRDQGVAEYKKQQTDTIAQARALHTARRAAAAPTGAADTVFWNPEKSILTLNGMKYKKSADKGWIDFATKDIISQADAAEIQTAFDKATGRQLFPSRNKKVANPNAVIIPDKQLGGNAMITITKDATDGKWYTPDGEVIVNPTDIAKLDQRLKNKRKQVTGMKQTTAAQMSGTMQSSPTGPTV
jgi:hypothetical protein